MWPVHHTHLEIVWEHWALEGLSSVQELSKQLVHESENPGASQSALLDRARYFGLVIEAPVGPVCPQRAPVGRVRLTSIGWVQFQ